MPERKKYTDEELNALKPSQLLRLAVEDAKLCEQDDQYELHMSEWHTPKDDGVCLVCMAGAIMAKSQRLHPSVKESDIWSKGRDRSWASAINNIRDGYDSLLKTDELDLLLAEYDDELGLAPWDTYLKVADMMEARGS